LTFTPLFVHYLAMDSIAVSSIARASGMGVGKRFPHGGAS
jgi:hypothetical protein